MKIGLGSYALAWSIGVPGYLPKQAMDVFAFLDCAALHGFKLVQIADNLPLDLLSDKGLERLKNHARNLDIAIELGTRGILAGNLERYLELATFFDASLLRVVVDAHDHHPATEEVRKILRPILPRFEQAEIKLALENHDRFKARDLIDIVDALDSPYLGICLDTVNSFGALEGPEVVIRTLEPHVINLHIKDFDIKREAHNMGFQIFGTPAGQGVLNIPKIIQTLNLKERNISIILELWPSAESRVEETIVKELAWVKQSADFLFKL